MSDLEEKIAIIGSSIRVPGANNLTEFWENLRNGKETISHFTEAELKASGANPNDYMRDDYVSSRGIVPDIDKFDAEFFQVSAMEAKILDPQHRIMLECAWEAIESAGYYPNTYPDRIGVFAGSSLSYYLLKNLLQNQELLQDVDQYQLLLGNDKDFLATRIAYKLNLRGPSLNIQTGCSSSLVACHVACQNILNGECEMALAGGVSFSIPQVEGYLYKKDMIGSPDGHCYAFDARAQGTVKSNGAAFVLLKSLATALKDGDQILGVIAASSVNNDGSNKVGFTAPSVAKQADVINEAISVAEVNPENIAFIEAHGTGTVLGDPIEIQALTKVFNSYTQRKQFCAISSLKTNIGHLDVAAGVCGLIKAMLQLKNQKIVPSLNFANPNPKIDFANSPFYVSTELKDLPAGTCYAGVSAFGVGGTNVHMILETPAKSIVKTRSNSYYIYPWSTKQKQSLSDYQHKLAEIDFTKISEADLAFTLQQSRSSFKQRDFIIAEHGSDLKSEFSKHSYEDPEICANKNIVFMFSGQGSQYVNMAAKLYANSQFFSEVIDYCALKLEPLLNLDIRKIIFANDQAQQLSETAITQPALFIIEYALAKQLLHLGIKPNALIGHSIGEYVAAVLSGIFSLDAALEIVAKRGKLVQSLPQGDMLAVSCNRAVINKFITEDISLAVVNAEEQLVVSGEAAAINKLQAELEQQKIVCRILHTSHAFHSHMLEPILAEFTSFVASFKLNPPQLPLISNVTGDYMSASDAIDPEYWTRQLRSSVLFSDGIKVLNEKLQPLFIEVGPGRTLESLVKLQGITNTINILPHPYEKINDYNLFLNKLAQIWQAGLDIKWQNLMAIAEYKRISLPSYPWGKQSYWVAASSPSDNSHSPTQQTVTKSPIETNVKLDYASPQALAEFILNLWKKLLDQPGLTVDANIFRNGADSLAAVQFVNACPAELREHVSIVDLYQFPTVESITQNILQKLVTVKTDSIESEADYENELFNLDEEL